MTPEATQGNIGVLKDSKSSHKDSREGSKAARCSLVLQKAGELVERPAQQAGDRPEGHYSREQNEAPVGNQML